MTVLYYSPSTNTFATYNAIQGLHLDEVFNETQPNYAQLNTLGWFSLIESEKPEVKCYQDLIELTPVVSETDPNVYVRYYATADKVFADPNAFNLMPSPFQLPTEAEFIATWKADLKAKITALRWKAQTAAIEVNGVTVDASPNSATLISQALSAVTAGVIGPTIPFKSLSGWTELDQVSLEAIVQAITVQVQTAFSKEQAKHAEIDALENTIAALDAYVVSF